MQVVKQDAAAPLSGLQRAQRWLATIAAAAASTFALDFVATSAGLILVASELLAGIGHVQALVLAVASYGVWGAGLWAMLGANWELLQRTGASVNIPAKAAYDLAARWKFRPRWRRAVTDLGYLGTELSKEAPYYIGAAGAALFTDTISAVDAIVFIAGANFAAAAYGFLMARGMRLFVRWRIRRAR
jgi:hypothetical protein